MSALENGSVPIRHLKIVVLGDTNTGKTSIIRRLCYGEFTRHYTETVGAEFHLKRQTLPENREVSIRISDVAGSEFQGNMLPNYLFKTNIVIIVYDIAKASSFENLSRWLDEIGSVTEKLPMCAILGNKCDLEHHRAVKLEAVRHFTIEHKLRHYLVSAKTGECVNTFLLEMVARYLGVKLTNIDKERQEAVVMAELVNTPNVVDRARPVTRSSSSVCCVQ